MMMVMVVAMRECQRSTLGPSRKASFSLSFDTEFQDPHCELHHGKVPQVSHELSCMGFCF